jgi:hypothetical protein
MKVAQEILTLSKASSSSSDSLGSMSDSCWSSRKDGRETGVFEGNVGSESRRMVRESSGGVKSPNLMYWEISTRKAVVHNWRHQVSEETIDYRQHLYRF